MATDLKSPKQTPPRHELFVDEQLERASRRIHALDLGRTALWLLAVTMIHALVMSGLFLSLDSRQFSAGWFVQIVVWSVYLGALFFLLGKLLIRSLSRVNPYYAARQIEDAIPGAKNSVVNWLDLRKKQLPASIRDALGLRAARDLKTTDPDQALGSKHGWSLAVVAGVLLVALSRLFIKETDRFGSLMGHAFYPLGDVALTTETRISLLDPADGDIAIAPQKRVFFRARLGGVVPRINTSEAPRVLYRYNPGDTWASLLLEPERLDGDERIGAGNWIANMPGDLVQNGFDYKIAAGDAETRKYTVTVRSQPEVTRFEIAYHYRPYMHQPDARRVYPNQSEVYPSIYEPVGTEVAIQIRTNRELRSGKIELTQGKDFTEVLGETVAEEPHSFRVKFKLENPGNGTFRVHFTSRTGEENAGNYAYTLDIRPDKVPDVNLTRPAKDVSLPANGVLRLEGAAGDDWGMRSLSLHMEVARGPNRLPPINPKPYRPEMFQQFKDGSCPYPLEYKDFIALDNIMMYFGERLELAKGDVLTYWLEATDNREYPEKPGQVGKSKPYQVNIIDPEDEQKQQADRQQAEQNQKQHEQQQDQDLKQQEQERNQQKQDRQTGKQQNRPEKNQSEKTPEQKQHDKEFKDKVDQAERMQKEIEQAKNQKDDSQQPGQKDGSTEKPPGANGDKNDAGTEKPPGANSDKKDVGTEKPPGANGDKKDAGTEKPPGANGDKKDAGTEKHPGANGDKKDAGTEKPPGANGDKKDIGAEKPPGANGDKKDAGTKKTPGANGDKKDAGTEKPPGANGDKKDAGTKNTPGANTDKKDAGTEKPPGAIGDKKDVGTEKPPGANGDKKDAGTEKPPGAIGDKKDVGTEKPPGANGDKKDAGTEKPPGANGDKKDAGTEKPPGANGDKKDAGTEKPPGANGDKKDAGTEKPPGANGDKKDAGTEKTPGANGDKKDAGTEKPPGANGDKKDAGTDKGSTPGSKKDDRSKNATLEDIAKLMEAFKKGGAPSEAAKRELENLAENAKDESVRKAAEKVLRESARPGEDLNDSKAYADAIRRAGNLNLEDLRTRVTPDMLKKAGLTKEEFDQFLDIVDGLQKSPPDKNDSLNQRGNPQVLPSVGPNIVDPNPDGNTAPLQNGRGQPPPGFREIYRLWTTRPQPKE